MKTALMITLAVLSFATAAQAKTGSKAAKEISGRDAINEITAGNFLSTKDVFEGDDCTMELKTRGHNLEIIAKQKNKTVTVEFSEDEKYKLADKSNGDDSVQVLTSLDKKMSLTIEAADDAFDRVSLEKDGTVIDCEMDM